MNCVVRPFQQADHEAVNHVALAAFSQYRHDYDNWDAFSHRIGKTVDLAGEAELFVAEYDGEIAGAVMHVGPGKPRSPTFPDDWSVIRMLVVAPGYRGRGVGRALVAACVRSAMRDGAPVLGLHTSPIMVTALRLYTELGFTRDCDLDPIYGVPYSRYILPAGRLHAALDRLTSGASSVAP